MTTERALRRTELFDVGVGGGEGEARAPEEKAVGNCRDRSSEAGGPEIDLTLLRGRAACVTHSTAMGRIRAAEDES